MNSKLPEFIGTISDRAPLKANRKKGLLFFSNIYIVNKNI